MGNAQLNYYLNVIIVSGVCFLSISVLCPLFKQKSFQADPASNISTDSYPYQLEWNFVFALVIQKKHSYVTYRDSQHSYL